MAIREKLRAKFSKNKNSTSESTSRSSDEPIPGHYTGRTDIEYYKPHEIPKSKYRGRVDKAHQDKLEAFSFGDAFTFVRRPSAALSGTFSPGGTKAFSRRTSYAASPGAHTPVRSRRSSLSSDANNSFSIPSSASASTHMRSIPTAATPASATVDGNIEEGTDLSNTGLTKTVTAKDSQSPTQADGNVPIVRLDRQATASDKDDEISNDHIEHSQTSADMPFTAEELTQAMTRATIAPQVTVVV